MGSRSGDMDPAVPLHLMNILGLSTKEMDTILNKKSGLLGVCGHNDLRTIIDNKVQRQLPLMLAHSVWRRYGCQAPSGRLHSCSSGRAVLAVLLELLYVVQVMKPCGVNVHAWHAMPDTARQVVLLCRQRVSAARAHCIVAAVLQAAGDERAKLALDMFVYRVRKYIGAYSAALSGNVDALIFSAGIGENSSIIRSLICEDFKVGRLLVQAGT